jgi:hypothetical protein
LKVETDIITSITTSPVVLAAILVIMYVETLKTSMFVIGFYYNVLDITLVNNFQYLSQFVDTENIIHQDQREIAQITVKFKC